MSVIGKNLFIPKYTRENYETANLVIKLRMEENESETGFDKKTHSFKGLVDAQCNVCRIPRFTRAAKSFDFELANVYNLKLFKHFYTANYFLTCSCVLVLTILVLLRAPK